MSIIAIVAHNENINDVAEQCDEQIEGISNRYKTKSRSNMGTNQMQKTKIKPYATMGLPEEKLPDPNDFLRKCAGKQSHKQDLSGLNLEKHSCQRKEKFNSKEFVVEYVNRKKAKEKEVKNFISENIKTVVAMKPKEPKPKVVVDPYGDTTYLGDGFEPIYLKLQKFGNVPRYLQVQKNQKISEQQQKVEVDEEQPLCRFVELKERERILEGLKKNYEELQNQFQKLPIFTDTLPKRNRKSKLEAELKQLEKDITLVEKHSNIFVYDDNFDFID